MICLWFLFECLKFQPKIGRLKSLIVENEELKFLFTEEYNRYSKEITIPIYDINEILCEKVRAILTRKVLKGRDFIDLYFILDKFSLNIQDFKVQIIEKTLFTLKSEKFKKNLIEKVDFISGLGTYDKVNSKKEIRIISNLGTFSIGKKTKEMRLLTVHPGVDVEGVQENTGFDLIIPKKVPRTEIPSKIQLRMIREEIDPMGTRRLENLSGKERLELLMEIIEKESKLKWRRQNH